MISIRRAALSDSDLMYQWRNHPTVRAASLCANLIQKEQHEQWLIASLDNPERILFVGEAAGKPFGVLRYDIDDDLATASIYLDPEKLNHGFGTCLLKVGNLWLKENMPSVKEIIAEILDFNAASLRAFQKAGYVNYKSVLKLRLYESELV